MRCQSRRATAACSIESLGILVKKRAGLRHVVSACRVEIASTHSYPQNITATCENATTAFSLLVYTEQLLATRLFLKKRGTPLQSAVQSRSENALEPGSQITGLRGPHGNLPDFPQCYLV